MPERNLFVNTNKRSENNLYFFTVIGELKIYCVKPGPVGQYISQATSLLIQNICRASLGILSISHMCWFSAGTVLAQCWLSASSVLAQCWLSAGAMQTLIFCIINVAYCTSCI